MKAPFPYFGGKSKVADIVWAALGSDMTNYVEPFAGSLAVLLNRPGGPGKVETVNDYDGLLANAWRAMKYDPDAVAIHADNPVNECDLHAHHLWLCGQRDALTEFLMAHPDFYDVKSAGWCSGTGSWIAVDGRLVKGNSGRGINRTIPHLSNSG